MSQGGGQQAQLRGVTQAPAPPLTALESGGRFIKNRKYVFNIKTQDLESPGNAELESSTRRLLPSLPPPSFYCHSGIIDLLQIFFQGILITRKRSGALAGVQHK